MMGAGRTRAGTGQYHQPVSAKAQTRSPKSEGRKKAETRNPKCPSVASAFGIRPSEFGFGRLAAGGTVQYAPQHLPRSYSNGGHRAAEIEARRPTYSTLATTNSNSSSQPNQPPDHAQ